MKKVKKVLMGLVLVAVLYTFLVMMFVLDGAPFQ
jgi:hypothetical protein|tara:strand:+ start:480 stop:581 length:102 start_codon:yes stop_codon:yes gene_type:complete